MRSWTKLLSFVTVDCEGTVPARFDGVMSRHSDSKAWVKSSHEIPTMWESSLVAEECHFALCDCSGCVTMGSSTGGPGVALSVTRYKESPGVAGSMSGGSDTCLPFENRETL